MSRPLKKLVRFKNGVRVELPDGVDHKYVAQQLAGPLLELIPAQQQQAPAGPSDPEAPLRQATGISPMTTKMKLRDVGERARRAIASILGVDFDAMQALEDQGIKVAMLPFGPPSSAGDKLLKAAYPDWHDAKNIGKSFASVVDPEKYAYRKGSGFNSLVVDYNGHLIDLGDMIHANAMEQVEPELFQNVGSKTHDALAAALAKNKFVRVNFTPGNIGLEMGHAPSPHQIETLTQLYEKFPKALGSYDFTAGAKNDFRNGVPASEVMDKIFELYYKR